MAENPPKIVVDSDWKSQARAEKERLAAAEKQKASEKQRTTPQGVEARPGAAPTGEHAVPESDFTALVGTLATQALMYMGAFPDPETGRAIVSLDHARFHIDMLQVLEEKTKGNLTPDEEQHLKQVLYQLRLQYVEISKAVAQAIKNKQAQSAGGPGAPPVPGAAPAAPGAGPRLKT